MSRLIVVAVFDSAVQMYGRPMFVPARGSALRSFIDEINRKAEDNPLYAHPDDFVMHQVATFDDETGVFENCNEVLGRGKDLKRSE